MDILTHLSDRLGRTVTGPMWHGPSLIELLEGVSPTDAALEPIPGAHSIWEIVLHVTAWVDIGRERMFGRMSPTPSVEEDWPRVPTPTGAAWTEALDRLRASHRALADSVARLEPAGLGVLLPGEGTRYTVASLLDGIIEHGAYHGGQIALLKRALANK
jgi:uncharacterized damage-inducible protein DinB